MSKTLREIAKQLNDSNKKVQLIFAFNGTGKTRLSREFKKLVTSNHDGGEDGEQHELTPIKYLYYNAFTEDLFYWDNNLEDDGVPKLIIQPNSFTDWILVERGQDQNITENFQRYTDEKLTPSFIEKDKVIHKAGKRVVTKTFPEVKFSFDRGTERSGSVKISKGEESNFIWSVFYTLLQEVVEIFDEQERSKSDDNQFNKLEHGFIVEQVRSKCDDDQFNNLEHVFIDKQEQSKSDDDQFNNLEYVFIDDPVSSLDDSHLIELAVDLAGLIKSSKPNLKFVITTHNPLFYNVLFNELRNNVKEKQANGTYKLSYNANKAFKKYRLEKQADGSFKLQCSSDHPFSYHLFLLSELQVAIEDRQIRKYHFNFIRNILEKMATFLGYSRWSALLPKTPKDEPDPFANRILNLSSHSAHAGDELAFIEEKDKEKLAELVSYLIKTYHFKSEVALERELIQDLQSQGYEFLHALKNPEGMLANVRTQLQTLNNVQFLDVEWGRFVETYLDKPSEGIVDKSRKVHDNYRFDFVFDNGRIKNIYLFDKTNIARNKVQVIKQFKQTDSHANRYDVTILINGLPLVQIELKKRGVAIHEAFDQVHRYSKESFNSENSLYKYLQLFVISNGTDSRYFANTTKRNKNSFDFTMNWAKSDNSQIKELKEFTATFFQKNTLLNVLLRYSVFDVNNTLLVMRPYQIAAAERILWKVNSSFQAKIWSKPESGGFVWHTTGSGKTLTSFKVARLACELDFIDKVFYVVDRKDLDFQTMKEYQRLSPDSVNGSDSTAGLKRNLDLDDNKIVVTTIQKLNNLIKSESSLQVFNKQVVFIFDECHRSQFGEAQKNLTKKFKKFYQFGFTGTPIFPQNVLGAETTASVFGRELHSYVITDAIRDEKVLKFKVDYNDVRPQFKSIESEQNEKKLTTAKYKEALQHPERIREISQYILKHFPQKTHRLKTNGTGFNAMFAVSSVDAAKLYYKSLNKLQQESDKPLKIATIFTFTTNEEQDAIGDISDESFDVNAMHTSAKEFLAEAIDDYNDFFKTNFSIDSKGFQNYYRDLAKRVKNQEIDLLIVVGMFLTGFDAPTLNTLFVDKNLRYHGLIQAYSRTNRIFDATKTFGNIVTFRNLEKATVDAITLFGDKNTKNVVLEKSFKEYMDGFTDIVTSQARRGFMEVVNELEQRFPDPADIEKEQDKKDFVKLFGEYLKVENVLQNFDEFASLKALQTVDLSNVKAVEAFKAEHHLIDEELAALQTIRMLAERKVQDYRSTYNDIRDWLRREKAADQTSKSTIDWGDVVFEVDLLKSQEINLDYILELIFEHNKKNKNKNDLVDEVRRLIRASLGNRAKEGLILKFIDQTNLDDIGDKVSIIEAFYSYAQAEQQREANALIEAEGLNEEATRRYIKASLKREYASENGTALNETLPKMSPLNPQFRTKKQSVFEKISEFVEKFKGVGGQV